VGERIGEVGVSVGGAGGGDAVERGFDCAVTNRVDVDDKSIFVRSDAELVESLLIEEEFAVASGVLVGLGQVRRL